MEMEVRIISLRLITVVLVIFGCVFPANLFKMNQRNFFHAIFDEKGWILKYLPTLLAKKNKSE